jgi:hypothetical protein
MEKCIEDAHAIDDMLPDVFENWIMEQDIEDVIDWMEKWHSELIQKEREEAVRGFVEWLDKVGVEFVPVYSIGTRYEGKDIEYMILSYISQTKGGKGE